MKPRVVPLLLVVCALALLQAYTSANARETDPPGTGTGTTGAARNDPLVTTDPAPATTIITGHVATVEAKTLYNITEEASPAQIPDIREHTQADAPADPPVGGSAAQIVAFYNERANAIKAADKIIIRKHDTRATDAQIPIVLRPLISNALKDIYPDKDETVAATFMNGNSIHGHFDDFMPVNGSRFVSKLSAAYAESAACTAAEDGWLIRIHLADEPLDLDTIRSNAGGITNISELDKETFIEHVLLKSGYGSCMDMVFAEYIGRGETGSFDLRPMKAAGTLQNGRIAALVDQEGSMTSLTLSYTFQLDIRYLGMKIKLSGISRQEYQFSRPLPPVP